MFNSLKTHVVVLILSIVILTVFSEAAGATALDNSFGHGGERLLKIPSFARSADVQMCRASANGKMTVIGDFARTRHAFPSPAAAQPMLMARLDRQGRQLRLAGGQQWSALSAPRSHDPIGHIVVDPAGGVLYTYLIDKPGGTQPIWIRRMTPQGLPDKSFGAHGRANAGTGDTSDFGYANARLVVLRDGRIAWTEERSGNDANIALFDRRGKPISSFGLDGALVMHDVQIDSIQSGAGGSLLVSTRLNTASPPAVPPSITKLSASGDPVQSFGTSGTLRLPQVASLLTPSVMQQIYGAVISEQNNGHLLALGTIFDDSRGNVNTTREFDEFDPAKPQAPLWRSPLVGAFWYGGDGGAPDYNDSDALYSNGFLLYAELGGTTGSDTFFDSVNFTRIKPGESTSDASDLTAADIKGLVPESLALGRDGSTISVCGNAVAPATSSPKYLVVRRWKIR